MIYIQNKIGEQFKIEVVTQDTKLIDIFLDQYSKAGFSQIEKEDFNTDIELMNIDVMDEARENLICVLTTKRID